MGRLFNLYSYEQSRCTNEPGSGEGKFEMRLLEQIKVSKPPGRAGMTCRSLLFEHDKYLSEAGNDGKV